MRMLLLLVLFMGKSVDAVTIGTYRIGCDRGGSEELFYLDRTDTTDWSTRLVNTSFDNTAGGSMMVISSVGTTTYKIETAGKALTRASGETNEEISLVAYSGWSTQKWQIMDIGGGYYKIINMNSGNILTRTNDDGGTVTLKPDSNWSTQKWQLCPVDTSVWPAGSWDWVFDGVVRNGTSQLQILSRTNVLVYNSVFENVEEHGLYIEGCQNVYLKYVSANSITNGKACLKLVSVNDAIVDSVELDGLDRDPTWATAGLNIVGCTNVLVTNSLICNQDGNGISTKESADLVIKDSTVENCGLDPIDRVSAPFHGMYISSPDTQIINCTVRDSMDRDGISMRIPGLVQDCTISTAQGCGIIYWPKNEATGSSMELKIIRNTITCSAPSSPYNKYGPGIWICQNDHPISHYFPNVLIQSNLITVTSAVDHDQPVISAVHNGTNDWAYTNIDCLDNVIDDNRSPANRNYIDLTLMDEVSGNILN